MKGELPCYKGLTKDQVIENRSKFGANKIKQAKGGTFKLLKEVLTEPMFLLLIAACIIYFLVKQYSEGVLMLVAMVLVASISFFQERRSKAALEAVKEMSQPKVLVLRGDKKDKIFSEELVVGDILFIEEGEQIPIDGKVLEAHDFTVDESILTGESFAIEKNELLSNNKVYFGSTVKTGSAILEVEGVGNNTMLGQLGKSIEVIEVKRSRFQEELRVFVRRMALAGIVAFLVVLGINFYKSGEILNSLLFALALAMSILPEEIPVAFSTFMALGSWRLLKENVLAKDPLIVETLGSATVICIDKTGTITENKMSVAKIFTCSENLISTLENLTSSAANVLSFAMWSSEPTPFDPMEIAIHEAYVHSVQYDERHNFRMIHEYPLSGSPPVMTHVYENEKGRRIVACKGGVESVIRYSNLSENNANRILGIAKDFARDGYRVLGVAEAQFNNDHFPIEQKDFAWTILGLIALYDPPKRNIKEVLNRFYKAGIEVKIISGDYPETIKTIAREIDFKGVNELITGPEIENISEKELSDVIEKKKIFARMFPDAKLRVVQSLKEGGKIVAMIGDGVNDGPALRKADIGVAMGSKGTEIAKRASSIILLDNDLEKLFIAIVSGRKIYENLKKALRYILSIHIAIITTVTGPLLLGWDIVNIFSPIHIIFFELIMGPTCSIIYEREPLENQASVSMPRPAVKGFLSLSELVISVFQGLVISLGVLLIYYYTMKEGLSERQIRTIVFTNIVVANIFLTLENRSFKESILKSFQYKNPLIPFIIGLTIFLLIFILSFSFTRDLFLFDPISIYQITICVIVAFVSVLWLECYKLFNRKRE
ncbi:MAG: cation-translocating P-type ATPase [Sporocytophaga sp.]|uniref:cation-translocating P-type ATPase n=1 Tax=Sporocytophaga sp. TaxID=2231183 RepID=UPI001B2CC80B|nr:cation-translocating P-type ATPase [Sporocytophaga sp.]MBO9699075.1 cation-translocating P-type ATPase [Sporocytophaga sp.]